RRARGRPPAPRLPARQGLLPRQGRTAKRHRVPVPPRRGGEGRPRRGPRGDDAGVPAGGRGRRPRGPGSGQNAPPPRAGGWGGAARAGRRGGDWGLGRETRGGARGGLRSVRRPAPPALVARARCLQARTVQEEGQWAKAAKLWKEALEDRSAPVENEGQVLYN